MAFSAIKDAIVDVLENVDEIEIVFDYPEPSPQEFPCAFVVAVGGSSESRFDNVENLLTVQFKISVMRQLEYTSAAFEELYTAVDATLAELRKTSNDTLGGVCIAFDVAPAIDFVYTTDASQPMMICTFTVNARTLVSIT